MTENAGVDPRVTAAEQSAYPSDDGEVDATQVAEDPTTPPPEDRDEVS